MINRLEVTGIHTETNKDTLKYVKKKIGKLDSYMPKHARKSVHAEVRLKESKAKDKKQSTAEVVLYLPGDVLSAKETTVNMYAAIDIVEEKLKAQLKRYKDQNSAKKGNKDSRVKKLFNKIVRNNESI